MTSHGLSVNTETGNVVFLNSIIISLLLITNMNGCEFVSDTLTEGILYDLERKIKFQQLFSRNFKALLSDEKLIKGQFYLIESEVQS